MKKEQMKITIPKGTEIYSTHPIRSRIISESLAIVDNIYFKNDYLSWCNKVEWAGAGGYWRWTEITDEILNVNPELKEWIEEKKRMDE